MSYIENTHPGFYGNYKLEDVPVLEQAAVETGFEIEVRNDARDVIGRFVSGRVAVYVKGGLKDRTPLGRRFRELKAERDRVVGR